MTKYFKTNFLLSLSLLALACPEISKAVQVDPTALPPLEIVSQFAKNSQFAALNFRGNKEKKKVFLVDQQFLKMVSEIFQELHFLHAESQNESTIPSYGSEQLSSLLSKVGKKYSQPSLDSDSNVKFLQNWLSQLKKEDNSTSEDSDLPVLNWKHGPNYLSKLPKVNLYNLWDVAIFTYSLYTASKFISKKGLLHRPEGARFSNIWSTNFITTAIIFKDAIITGGQTLLVNGLLGRLAIWFTFGSYELYANIIGIENTPKDIASADLFYPFRSNPNMNASAAKAIHQQILTLDPLEKVALVFVPEAQLEEVKTILTEQGRYREIFVRTQR